MKTRLSGSRLSRPGKILAAAVACLLLAAAPTTRQGTPEQYVAAGIFDTGLTPELPQNADCPVMSSGFADRYNRSGTLRREYSRWLFHSGIDWGQPEGTPVVAIADGRVVRRHADDGGDTGNHLIIRHRLGQDDISSSYVHLSGFNVALDQEVKRGAIIGYVGATGRGVTYPHLHLNVLGGATVQVGDRKLRYRYDFLQLLSGDMTPIDPVRKRVQKVSVAYVDQHAEIHPPGAKVIWPFICHRR